MKNNIPEVNLKKYKIKKSLSKYIPEKIARKYNIAPLLKKENELEVVMLPPFNLMVVDDIEKMTGLKIKYFPGNKEEIDIIINKIYTNYEEKSLKLIENLSEFKVKETTDFQNKNILNKSPIVKLANIIIENAVKNNASDIHLEPQKDYLRLRYRVDGVLYSEQHLPRYSQAALISRFKIMADMDITVKRLPQDGRFHFEYENTEIDMRISSIPVIYGEKVVIRILNKNKKLLDLNKLGLTGENLKKYKHLLNYPDGIILVTGPTGSGKTTTLFSGLRYLNSPEYNIITIEDPVEYEINGINQIQASSEVGFDYSQALRSILRQDPDIIMVGEIRDEETAQMAVRAALTGHLVLSTLHTNDAISSITRLQNMGIPYYLVASTLRGIIAQRLIRKLAFTGTENSGYKGRTGIYEILEINKELRKLILNKSSKEDIEEKVKKIGFTTMKEDANLKIEKGITTWREVSRVIK